MNARAPRSHPRRPLARVPALVALLAALAAMPPACGRLTAQGIPTADACTRCHLQLTPPRLSEPARDFPDDIHAQRGFTCLDCHGGRAPDGSVSRDPSAGFLAKPERKDIPTLCGRCHSDARFMRDYNPALRVDQVAEYRTSVHGRRLMQDDDPDVATCVDCHPAHDIRPPSDPASTVHPLHVADLCGGCHADTTLMRSRGHLANELENYRASVHAALLYEDGDLSAPTCNDCHGNHGAAPPGLASVRNVCGQCHVQMGDLFGNGVHADLFTAQGLPGCVTCHGNHDIERPVDDDLLVMADSVCGKCHQAGTPEADVFPRIRALLDSLEDQTERSRALLTEARNLGMPVSQATFELDEVGNALTKARTAIHSFQVEPVRTEVANGLEITRATREKGLAALDEHRFRRVGLAVSTAIILLLIGALLMKLRQIEGRGAAGPSGSGGATSDPITRS